MHSWLVAGAVIEGDVLDGTRSDGESGLLLVHNERRGGRRDWSTPGGVVDAGESARDGLAREVHEETGLTVVSWTDLLYEVTVTAPDLGWDLRVEVHRAGAVGGDLAVGSDPDGIVTDARWVDEPGCGELLSAAPRWVAEPLLEWVDERFTSCRSFAYSLRGTTLDEMVVERVVV